MKKKKPLVKVCTYEDDYLDVKILSSDIRYILN